MSVSVECAVVSLTPDGLSAHGSAGAGPGHEYALVTAKAINGYFWLFLLWFSESVARCKVPKASIFLRASGDKMLGQVFFIPIRSA